jgi:hypothetical protein
MEKKSRHPSEILRKLVDNGHIYLYHDHLDIIVETSVEEEKGIYTRISIPMERVEQLLIKTDRTKLDVLGNMYHIVANPGFPDSKYPDFENPDFIIHEDPIPALCACECPCIRVIGLAESFVLDLIPLIEKHFTPKKYKIDYDPDVWCI